MLDVIVDWTLFKAEKLLNHGTTGILEEGQADWQTGRQT